MAVLFHDHSTRFIGRSDRDTVTAGYLKLREKLDAYEAGRFLAQAGDHLLTAPHSSRRPRAFGVLLVAVCGCAFSLIDSRFGWFLAVCFSVIVVIVVVSVLLPSPVFRAQCTALLCCTPREHLEHTCHLSVCKPPFRPRPRPTTTDDGVLIVPECFRPSSPKDQHTAHGTTTSRSSGKVAPLPAVRSV
jgi:hypothetical protein